MSNSKITTIERFDPTTKIEGKIEWMPLNELRGAKSKHSLQYTNKYGRDAIYQIALASDIEVIGDDLVHGKIGYTGKSNNIFSRLYALKLGKHTSSPYIRANLGSQELVARVMFVNDADALDQVENHIHRETEKSFGYRFAWKEASGGIDGTLHRIQDLIDRLESLDSLKEIINYAEDRAHEIWRATWRSED